MRNPIMVVVAIVFMLSSRLRYQSILSGFTQRRALSPSVNEFTLRNGDGADSLSLNTNTTKKYLLYFAQAGFANQQMCLKNAYVMAQMLDRVLLLPPILPHFGRGSTNGHMVLSSSGQHFQMRREVRESTMNPFFLYLQSLPVRRYLPMDHAIDIDYVLPGIEHMDVRTFHEQFYRTEMVQASIELDHGYSHFNTIWTKENQSEMLGRTVRRTAKEHGQIKILNQTYRGAVSTLAPYSEDILVMLDSFRTTYHEAVQATLPDWRPRLATKLRMAVGTHMADMATMLPQYYAAIHLRAGDGPFTDPRLMERTIRHVMRNMTIVLSEWLSASLATEISNATVGEVANTSQRPNRYDTVGLYVATDLDDFRDHPIFHSESSKMLDSIYFQHGVNVTILSQRDIGNATQILNGILYANDFFDVQMAVCASIGFVGTDRSSFSSLINQHRKSEQECFHSEPSVPKSRGWRISSTDQVAD
jgi:GDP-fucose protein O-fucosyltransferase